MPLGKLAKSTIQKGYNILQDISMELNKKKIDKKLLEIYSSDFYSYIPHTFGHSTPPIINTDKMIKDKLEMLASIE
jgi:poly [ADP-ribose] polymerase